MFDNAYLKAVLAAAIPVLYALNQWQLTNELNAPEMWLGGLGFVAAILVYVFPNRQTGIQRIAKFLAAAGSTLAVYVIQVGTTPGGAFDQQQLTTLIIGFGMSLLVWLSNNGNPPEPVESRQQRIKHPFT